MENNYIAISPSGNPVHERSSLYELFKVANIFIHSLLTEVHTLTHMWIVPLLSEYPLPPPASISWNTHISHLIIYLIFYIYFTMYTVTLVTYFINDSRSYDRLAILYWILKRGIFLFFFCTLFNTASSAVPQIPLCRRMLNWTRDCCDFGTESQTLLPLGLYM